MKKINLITLLIVGLALFIGSCQKEETDPKLNVNLSVASTIISPENGSATILLLADSANQFTVSWSVATYSVSGGVAIPMPTYSLQMASADSNFSNMNELFNTKNLTFETNVYDLNTKLNLFGFTPDSASNIQLRIVSGVSTAPYTNDTSDAITINITPFEPPITTDTALLWVPGDYQGWSPATAPNVWSLDNNGIYTGYVYYPAGGSFEFKFTSAPDWTHTNFGAGAGEGMLDTDDGAGNLMVPDSGGYMLTCDTNALTWSYEVQNWGVVGSGILTGDWSEDVNLTYDVANNVLTVTIDVTEPQDGGDLRFKFRANDDSTNNLGLTDPVDGNKLSYSGQDIPMPDGAGNYTFILDMSQPTPTYELIKN